MFADHPLLKPFTQLEPSYFPSEELREAIAHREEIIPLLLDAFRDFANKPEEYSEEEGNCLHMVALVLLAQFRESAILPIILDIVNHLDSEERGVESAHEELMCAIPEYGMARVLASVAGDTSKLKAIILDYDQNIEFRCRAMEALKSCYFEGDMERNELTDFLSCLFWTLSMQHDSFEFFPFWMCLYDLCLDIHPHEMLDDIQDACDAGFLGEMSYGRTFERAKDYYKETPEQWFDSNRERLIKEFGYIREADKELEKWGMNQIFEFDQNELDEITRILEEKSCQRANQNKAIGNVYSQIFRASSDTPFTREHPEIGRNDPCPCGSGKQP